MKPGKETEEVIKAFLEELQEQEDNRDEVQKVEVKCKINKTQLKKLKPVKKKSK